MRCAANTAGEERRDPGRPAGFPDSKGVGALNGFRLVIYQQGDGIVMASLELHNKKGHLPNLEGILNPN